MKLLFIQLSDMHCSSSAAEYKLKIDQAAAAIKTIGDFDKIILVFSGDLTNTADENEFKAAKQVIRRFISKIAPLNHNDFIHVMIVPGNHDMVLPEDARTSAEIETWDKEEHLYSELDRISSFFNYSNRKNCFKEHKLYDRKIVDFGDVKIQFCLLNSAPYSTRHPDDKQLHYFPSYVAEKLMPDPDADIKITVMHHHFEWCEPNTKEAIRKAIASDDITFFGHDHKAEHLIAKYSNGDTYNIIMGGKFDLALENDAAFNAVSYDSDTASFDRYVFTWSAEDGIFHPHSCGSFTKKGKHLAPSESYIEMLCQDHQGIAKHFTDYYVLPKLYAADADFSDGQIPDSINVDKLFDILARDKAVQIVGEVGVGKTTLLKYLYIESVNRGFIPLLIEKRDYRDSRIDRMFKDLFSEQYDMPRDSDYDIYLQSDDSKKIVFIDDADLIDNPKARQNLINSILDSGKLLIYSSSEKDYDIAEDVKNKLQGKTVSSLEIQLFYKETRDQLVRKVALLSSRSNDEINLIISALDYMVQTQTGFFNFTPAGMLQYIRFFLNGGAEKYKGVQTISLVFETNIRNAIFACTNEYVASVYLAALEFIADKLYFELKAESIPIASLEEIIGEYNQKKKAKVVVKDFLEICVNAHLLKQPAHSLSVQFYDNNTYAYFVAKAINREFERNPDDRDKFTFVMNNICFGINDSIILFLSFIRNNAAIVLKIAERSLELLREYPEWDFEKKNIPFLHQTEVAVPKVIPSTEEKRNVHHRIEQIEKERHEAVKFKSVFDYNPDDAQKPQYVISKALKYVHLVGRALVDQYGSLEADEITPILDALFSVPQKAVYAAMKPTQDRYEELVASLTKFAEETVPEARFSEKNIRKMIGQVGAAMALDIFNNVAYNAANRSTINVLRERANGNANQRVLELMMEENTGMSSEFVSRAIALCEDLDSVPYAKILIMYIVRKHVINNEDMDHKDIDRLVSGKVISPKEKAGLLHEQNIKAKS